MAHRVRENSSKSIGRRFETRYRLFSVHFIYLAVVVTMIFAATGREFEHLCRSLVLRNILTSRSTRSVTLFRTTFATSSQTKNLKSFEILSKTL